MVRRIIIFFVSLFLMIPMLSTVLNAEETVSDDTEDIIDNSDETSNDETGAEEAEEESSESDEQPDETEEKITETAIKTEADSEQPEVNTDQEYVTDSEYTESEDNRYSKELQEVIDNYLDNIRLDGNTVEIEGIDYRDLNTGTVISDHVNHFKSIQVTAGTPFIYDDDLVLEDSSVFSPEIAKMTASMAAAAYSEGTISSIYSQIGIDSENIYSDNYSKSSSDLDCDFVAYSIGHKLITDGEGKNHQLYFLSMRGTPKSTEWISNFRIGHGGYHVGFYTAAEEIEYKLEEIINSESDEEKAADHVFVLTGHSRGAAVANIIAGRLNQGYVAIGYASRNRVFGYTYASPAVSSLINPGQGESGIEPGASNIFNFINPADIVPQVPLDIWGYKRNGIDVLLPKDETDPVYQNFKNRYKIVNGKDYSYSSIAEYISLFSSMNVEEATEPLMFLGKIIADSASYLTAPSMLVHLLGSDAEILNDTYIENLLVRIAGDSSFDYVRELEALQNYALNMYFSASDTDKWKSFSEWLENEENAQKVEYLKSRIRSSYSINSASSLKTISDKLADCLQNIFRKYHRSTFVLLAYYTREDTSITHIFDAHSRDVYVQYINSMYYGDHGWDGWTGDFRSFSFTGNNIRSIGNYCFNGIPLSGDLDLTNITAAGAYAFYGADFSSILLDNEADYLGDRCFGEMSQLKKVTIPVDMLYTWNGTKDISPFGGDSNIEEIIYKAGQSGEMPEEGPSTTIAGGNGKLNAKMRIEAIAYQKIQKIVYEEGIKNIAACANYPMDSYGYRRQMTALTSVELPSTLEKIGDYAFYNFGADFIIAGPLTEMKEAGHYAFYGCSKFSAAMPSIERVGESTFYNCAGLTEEDIVLPGKIQDFPAYSFYGCTGLQEELELTGEEKLGDQCFGAMTQLKKVTIPVDMLYTWNGTKDISPFGGDSNIEEIIYKAGQSGEMPEEGPSTTIAGGNGKLNAKMRIEAIAYQKIQKIVYEEGIKNIAACANYPMDSYGHRCRMTALTSVELPSTLEKVGDYAFYGTKITSAYLLRNVKEIGSYAFDGISNLTLYVYRNTYAHQYALTNNKNYVLLDPAAAAISLPSEKELPLGSTEQLTITYTPADATDPIFWVSSDESIVSIDENGNAKALSTGTAIITATTDTGLSAQSVITVSSKGVSVYGSSLALEGKIGINFYLNIAEEELEYLNVVMTMNGQTTTVPASEGKASTVSGQKLRMFVYPVAAKEMRDKVTLTVEDAEGNKIKLTKDETDYTEGYPFSAADYFARAETAGQERTKKLARVLNNYGKYAQIYFNHNTEEVTDLTDVSDVTLETLAPYQAVQTENKVAGLTYVGGTTMLDDAVGYRLYFKIDTSHQISDYTFKMDGKKVTPVKSGSQYYIEKTDIAAKDLGVKNTVEVTDGENTFGIQYCALSYAYRALELTAEDKIPLQNMCRAMYLYNQQAIEYFNS